MTLRARAACRGAMPAAPARGLVQGTEHRQARVLHDDDFSAQEETDGEEETDEPPQILTEEERMQKVQEAFAASTL